MSTLSRILNRSRRAGGDDSSGGERGERIGPASQFVLIADRLRRAGKYEDAVAVCLEGLANHPTYVSGYVTLAQAYQFSGDIAKAVASYEKVVELAPDNITGHMGLADVYETDGRFCEASRHLRAAMQLGADGPDLRIWLERLVRLASKPCDQGVPNLRVAGTEAVLRLLRKKKAVLEAYRNRVQQGAGLRGGGDYGE